MTGRGKIGYREIADYYEHLIRTGKLPAGELLPSEDALAGKHGVTRTTLRRAFAVLVNRGLVVKRQGRGSYVASAEVVAERARGHVVIAVWRAPVADDEFALERKRRRHGHYEFTQGVVDALSEYGRPFRICYFDASARSVEKVAAKIREEKDVGILGFDVEYPESMDGLLSLGLPLVCVDSLSFGRSVDVVQADNRGGMAEATLHLLRTTPGPLTFVGSRASFERGGPHQERLEGFREAHRKLGRELSDDYVFFDWIHPGAGQEAARKMLELDPRPTGVVCSDDDFACGVFAGLRSAGVAVPGEVSLVGFGNAVPSRANFPGLSTVSMDIAAMGGRAVELLEDRIKNPGDGPAVVTVPTRLILRQSTLPHLPAGMS
ncbi:MAG TPA: GntR family transcriptional regulator [Planctomycetota bacterium]|nr:GntR family transcriptional regulator [Planctomycetota bacterium]